MVRPGEPADLDAIGQIQAASPEAAQWNPSDYLNYNLRVAIFNTRVAGFVVLRTLAPGESEILNLAVAPDCRRQGIARALLETWLREFRGDVFLEVRASNQTAQEFYKSLGFQQLLVRPKYYASPVETGIVMKFHSC